MTIRRRHRRRVKPKSISYHNEAKGWLDRYNRLINIDEPMEPWRMQEMNRCKRAIKHFIQKGMIKPESVNLMESHLYADLSPEEKAFQTALGSPAIVYQFPGKYPEHWNGRIPLKVEILHTLKVYTADMGQIKKGQWYYAWVNSFGEVAAIMPDTTNVPLQNDDFVVIEWHKPLDEHQDE